MKQQYIIVAVFTFIFINFALPLWAQPSLPTPPASAPIDGGLSILIAAGAGYGIKKMRDKKKNQEADK